MSTDSIGVEVVDAQWSAVERPDEPAPAFTFPPSPAVDSVIARCAAAGFADVEGIHFEALPGGKYKLRPVGWDAEPAPRALPTRESIARGLSEADRSVLGDDTRFDDCPDGSEVRLSWLAEADYVLDLLREHASASGEAQHYMAELNECQDALEKALRERDEARAEVNDLRVDIERWKEEAGDAEELRAQLAAAKATADRYGTALVKVAYPDPAPNPPISIDDHAVACVDRLRAELQAAQADTAAARGFLRGAVAEGTARGADIKRLESELQAAESALDTKHAKLVEVADKLQAVRRELDVAQQSFKAEAHARLETAEKLCALEEQHEALRAAAVQVLDLDILAPDIGPVMRLRALLKPATPDLFTQLGGHSEGAQKAKAEALSEMLDQLRAGIEDVVDWAFQHVNRITPEGTKQRGYVECAQEAHRQMCALLGPATPEPQPAEGDDGRWTAPKISQEARAAAQRCLDACEGRTDNATPEPQRLFTEQIEHFAKLSVQPPEHGAVTGRATGWQHIASAGDSHTFRYEPTGEVRTLDGFETADDARPFIGEPTGGDVLTCPLPTAVCCYQAKCSKMERREQALALGQPRTDNVTVTPGHQYATRADVDRLEAALEGFLAQAKDGWPVAGAARDALAVLDVGKQEGG